MDTQPLVSVSVLSYNHVDYIGDCLDSILEQERDFELEILIHDDGSTDGTQDVIRKYQEQFPHIIKPIIQPENLYTKGFGNFGLRYNFTRAKGKYIAMFDADDYWIHPQKLQMQVAFLDENPDYVIVGNLRQSVTADKKPIEGTIVSVLSTPCLLFRNVFREDILTYPKKIVNEDVFIVTYVMEFGKAKVLDFIGSVYRHVGTSSAWAHLSLTEKAVRFRPALKTMLEFFKQYGYKKSVRRIRYLMAANEIRFVSNAEKIGLVDFFRAWYYVLMNKRMGEIKSLAYVFKKRWLK